MRIGIVAVPLVARQHTGIANYAFNTIRHLEQIDQENDYYLYSHRDFSLPFTNQRWQKRIGSGLTTWKATVWLYTSAAKKIASDKIDLFWSPSHLIVSLPNQTINLLTVHDLNWHWCPETMLTKWVILGKLICDRLIKKADHIIVGAQFTAKYLQEKLNIPPNRISVIYYAAGEQYYPHDKQESAKYIASKYATSERYILAVGTVEPRKNIESLLKAYALLKKQSNFNCHLLIAGMRGWKNSKIFNTHYTLNLMEQVKFLGYVPDEDMPKLYSGAMAFVFPSLYEGFGIPLLEAMACGTPVVVSNTSTMPEVVGNAGIYIDPYNIENIAQGIYSIVSNKSVRQKLISIGFQRVKQFTWRKTAESTLKVFEKIKK